MFDSFLTYRSGRWFWWASALSLLSIGLYAWHDLPDPPNGGTWLGYTLGSIGAALIVWLIWLGRRKRDYGSNAGTVQGWTSAHVYLGTALIIIATLHTGFQFGWNLHTLAYTLMMIVILSGFFGIWAYARYPSLMTENTGGKSRPELYTEIAELDRQLQRIAEKGGPEVATAVASALERTVVGGSWLAQLRGEDLSEVQLPGKGRVSNAGMNAIVDFVIEHLGVSRDGAQGEALRELSTLLGNRARLLARVRRDVQLVGLLRAWLFVHVPVAFACLAALTAHIVSVFIYW